MLIHVMERKFPIVLSPGLAQNVSVVRQAVLETVLAVVVQASNMG